mmetsp:Transcript_20396/g.50984  ORF Transcript_20396/g.50984 Transcript_20396/m.50984 type:complete len:81 (+) Transcript_20396:870-1112(+)
MPCRGPRSNLAALLVMKISRYAGPCCEGSRGCTISPTCSRPRSDDASLAMGTCHFCVSAVGAYCAFFVDDRRSTLLHAEE